MSALTQFVYAIRRKGSKSKYLTRKGRARQKHGETGGIESAAFYGRERDAKTALGNRDHFVDVSKYEVVRFGLIEDDGRRVSVTYVATLDCSK